MVIDIFLNFFDVFVKFVSFVVVMFVKNVIFFCMFFVSKIYSIE